MGGNYSTTEMDTGFTWLDGKPIYKKTIDWGPMPNNARVNKTGQYPNGANVIWIEGIAIQRVSSGGGAVGVHNIPYVSATGNYDTVFCSDKSVGQVSVATDSDRSTWNAYITLYYTKAS